MELDEADEMVCVLFFMLPLFKLCVESALAAWDLVGRAEGPGNTSPESLQIAWLRAVTISLREYSLTYV